MEKPRTHASDPKLLAAVAQLEAMVAEHYPDATFVVFRGDDPDGLYLRVTIDTDDTDEVFDVVADALYEIQVEQELPVYFVTAPPLECVAEYLGTRSQRRQLVIVPPHR
jgi:hypothetical protein